MPLLTTENLYARIDGRQILEGISFVIEPGETHFLMGPNGSGKTTFAAALMGDPRVAVTDGAIFFDGRDITRLPPEDRARAGLYLWFQHPAEVHGLRMEDFLRSVSAARGTAVATGSAFRRELEDTAEKLHMPRALLDRNLNEGFSGGEKKRSELLQFSVLHPRLAILDECDSGLDVDGLRAAASALTAFVRDGGALLVITHHGAMRGYLRPERVHIMMRGALVRSGGEELVVSVEKEGFAQFGSTA